MLVFARSSTARIDDADSQLQLKKCLAKCDGGKGAVAEAVQCLQKNCGGVLVSVTAGADAKATGGADGADVGAGGQAGSNVAKPLPAGVCSYQDGLYYQ